MHATDFEADLPSCWDMTNVYSSLTGDDYRSAMSSLESGLASLAADYEARGVRRREFTSTPDLGTWAQVLEAAVARSNDLARLAETLDSYIQAHVTTNSYDSVAQSEASKLELIEIRRKQLQVRFQACVGSLGPWIKSLCEQSPILAEHRFYLEDTARQSKFLMSEELEALAAELCVDAGAAFSKLQGNVTSQLKVAWGEPDNVQQVPITVIRNFCFDADGKVRERAYHAEIGGWNSIRTTVAACLNGVKGTALTLARRRGRASVLDAALDENKIDRATLDALLGSIRESFDVFRRYLKAKARKLGKTVLPWWDLFAPLGSAHAHYTWSQARDFLVAKFNTFSSDLGDYAAHAFDARWIDGAPRDGKRGGAFCMPVVGVDESRILANFDGSFEQVSTLAHELGHGYHNHCQIGLTPLQRGTPSTLAETASIFCETLTCESALAEASSEEQLLILDAQLTNATQVCLDISSRFLFESAILSDRAKSELSPDDFCQRMQAAQRETYADAVDQASYHPYMWLWKPHYYQHEHNFYNFPYAFGHLFGLGLYAVYQRERESFVPRYKELLRATGQDYAAPLAARFGIDITQRDFWRRSLEVIAGQVRRFESL